MRILAVLSLVLCEGQFTNAASALADETVTKRFAELGTTPVSAEEATPAALTATLTSQIELWKPIIEAAGTYAD